MENPTILSSGRTSSATNSPEFEFWITRNPPSHQTTFSSADQLFSGGFLLPLNHPPDITTVQPTNPPSVSATHNPDNLLEPGSGSDIKPTSSKRWKDIFKKNPEIKEKEKKKKERNNISGAGAGSGTTAELNINLWPFSRSRSAGNSGSKPRTVVLNRKVSSAPCSRSNSTGDSKNRKWPSSPGRVGVHLGRSPVWQAKRLGQSRSLHDSLVRNSAEKISRPAKKSTAGVNGKTLNINVPTCIGYRKGLSCRGDVDSTGCIAGDETTATTAAGGDGGAGGLFNLRSLFTKKVF